MQNKSILLNFLGESDNSPAGLHFFLVLPEPYALAVNNTYRQGGQYKVVFDEEPENIFKSCLFRWTASYLDSGEREEIIFQDQAAFEKVTAF